MAGRLNGKLRVVSNDVESWCFPVIKGGLCGHDLAFHFYNGPDNFTMTKLDLLVQSPWAEGFSVAGRLNGKLRVVCNDVESWRFPVIKGRLRGHDLAFHFFDASDDFSATKLDLLFEGDRLYLHGAQGFFGAVPLNLTGGSYH